MSDSLSATDLTTERMLLRPWRSDDIEAVVGDSRLPHWAEDFPTDGDRVIAEVVAGASGTDRLAHRLMVERDTMCVIGSISLLWPPQNGEVEFGYGVVGSRRGRGYATEATRAMVSYALGLVEVNAVYADVELANPASVRVLHQAGLDRVSEQDGIARYRATTVSRG